MVIGGVGAKSQIPARDFDKSQLVKSDLAQVCVSYLLKRADSRTQPYEVRKEPRRLKDITEESTLVTTGETWQAVTDGNGRIPPLCQSADGHPAQVVMHRMFLALLARHRYEHIPLLGSMYSIWSFQQLGYETRPWFCKLNVGKCIIAEESFLPLLSCCSTPPVFSLSLDLKQRFFKDCVIVRRKYQLEIYSSGTLYWKDPSEQPSWVGS